MEIQETPPGKKDAKAWVTFNPAKCSFCSQCYKSYDNVANAASAAWNHVASCAETNLMIKGDGPTFLGEFLHEWARRHSGKQHAPTTETTLAEALFVQHALAHGQ